MQVELRLGGLITVEGREIALGKTHALLGAIAHERSVRGAAERLGLSYRAAWDRLQALEEAFGRPLAAKTKGHGTALTPLGEGLHAALDGTLRRFEAALAEEQGALQGRLATLVEARPADLRLAASHDPVLVEAAAAISGVALAVVGSRDAVGRLLAGEADAAGFHAGGADLAEEEPAAGLLRDPGFVVRPLFRREQGLMLAPGNPLGIAGVADLPRTGARVVNRQRGSGTRTWFDRLLAGAGIAPGMVRGYEVEEFTHQAVAALVASGAADAGLGVRAVAERFGLAFVGVGQETYYLASRAGPIPPALAALVAAVQERAGAMPGYALP